MMVSALDFPLFDAGAVVIQKRSFMGLRERRLRERLKRKKQILDAARALLFEKGLKATSISQIAKVAELGVGTIYFYYGSKEEIFAELQEEGLELLYTKIRQSHEDNDPPAVKLKNAALSLLQFSDGSKDYYDIINYFLTAPEVLLSPKLKLKVDRHGGKIISFVGRVVEAGIESGCFTKVDPKRFTIMFWGTLQGLIQYKKMKTTLLEGEDFTALYTYSVDHLIQSLSK